MIAARRGSPLAIGYGEGEMYLGSDALALAPFTRRIAYLAEGDIAVLDCRGVTVRDEKGRYGEARGQAGCRIRRRITARATSRTSCSRRSTSSRP